MPLLLLLLIGVPVIEIALFIEIGGYIGLWPTLAAILVTAVVGAMLVRAQGLATLARAQTELDAGRLPVKQLFDGVCILVAGALLLTIHHGGKRAETCCSRRDSERTCHPPQRSVAQLTSRDS